MVHQTSSAKDTVAPPGQTAETAGEPQTTSETTSALPFSAPNRPNLQRSVETLQKARGKQARLNIFASIQRTYGNSTANLVAATLARHRASKITGLQRHPEDAPLLEGKEQAAGAVEAAAAADVPVAPGAASTSASTSSEAAPSAEAGQTAPATEGDDAAKVKAMSLAKAEEVLKATFGGVKKIVPGNIVLLADRAATWDKYDEVCMADNLDNPSTGKKWAKGDAQKRTPGLDGFAWKGVVYVNQQTTLTTATAHEMLHLNTAAGFRSKVGETINEGTTETFAIKAITAASITVTNSAYPKQREVVAELIKVAGEDKLTSAYFKGGAEIDALIKAVDDSKGAGTFDKVKTQGDQGKFTEAKALLTAEKK